MIEYRSPRPTESQFTDAWERLRADVLARELPAKERARLVRIVRRYLDQREETR